MRSGIWTRSRCKRKTALALLLLFALTGCTGAGRIEETERRIAETGTRFDTTPVLPRALVDQNGYRTGSEKVVVFCTNDAGELFEVRNADNDAVVYTGSIRLSEAGDTGIGQFTAFQTEGRYYIYTDTVGSSYAFRIDAGLTDRIRAEALGSFYLRRCGIPIDASAAGNASREACHTGIARLQSDPMLEQDALGGWHTDTAGNRDVVTGCRALRVLLQAYEMHTDRFGDDTGIPESGNGIPDILDEARYEIAWIGNLQTTQGTVPGGVYVDEGESSDDLTIGDVTPEAAVAFAGAAARFAYVYGAFDRTYADGVLAMAEAAWSAAGAQRSLMQDASAFAAAADLYRVTGERKYENILSAWFGRDDFTSLFTEDEDVFYGGATYLETGQPVNVAVRNTVTETLLTESEAIAGRAAESAYLVAQTENEALLRDMCRLSVANSVTYNHEYTGMIENHIHYLAGRNPDAVNYLNDGTEYTYRDAGAEGVMLSPENSARLVLMTGGM